MRKYMLLSVLFLFSAGFCAMSADMDLSSSVVDMDDALQINYSFELDSTSVVNFMIKIGNLMVLNETYDVLSLSDIFEWNVGNTAAGNYTVSFTVDPVGDAIIVIPDDIVINPSARLDVLEQDTVYIFDEFVEKDYVVRNTGNIPLHVNVDPAGIYFLSVNPINILNLGINQSQSVRVNITKPEQDTDMSITYTGTNGSLEVIMATDISIISPYVNISMENISFTVTAEGTQILIDVKNEGNMDQNLTFTITTTSLGGTQIFTHSESAAADSEILVNFTIPTTDRVTKVEMSYMGSDGTTQVMEQRYDIVPGLGPLFDIFFSIWNSELLRGVVITLVVLLILILLWKIWRRKK